MKIDQLELEVQSSSTSAVRGIDALSASLSRLKTAIGGGIGLTSVANQLQKVNTALSGMDGSASGKINALASSLEKLRNLGGVKLSSSIAHQITAIGQSAASVTNADFSGISRLVQALEPLASFKASGFTSAISALNRLPKVAQALSSTDLNQFTSQIQQLCTALDPLANRLNTVSTAFSRLPSNIKRVATATDKMSQANTKATTSYMNLYAKVKMATGAVRAASGVIASWINRSNQYIEDVNLFNVSMGEYAGKAQEYAKQVGDVMGINPGEFMRYEGVFNTITAGFGVASDKAYLMSENLTQLGYDISSFFNIPVDEAMMKLQSGISGELEPLRRIGYDLSVARLQQEAFNLGIEKSVSAMTQAEKSQLRYYAILTQVTDAQGDMARTLNSPANQLRVLRAQVELCAQALGNIFIPVLNAVLPYAIALAKVIRYLAETIASFFNSALSVADNSGVSACSAAVGDLANNAGNAASGLGNAAKAVKKLKSAMLGIDELNIIAPEESSPGGGIGGGGIGGGGIGDIGGIGGGDLDIKLPTYKFIADEVNKKVDEIFGVMKKHLKEVAELVTTIGAAFLAWKIAKSVMDFFKMLEGFKGFNLSVSLLGLTMLLSDMNEFKKYLDDFVTNGPAFRNVAGMISEFAGMLGDAFMLLGNIRLGGALKIVQGVGEICVVIKDMYENGINWTNVATTVRGISNLAIGIGGLTKNFRLLGAGLALQGFLGVLRQMKNVITAIKTGDWDIVDWSELLLGAIATIGGIALALGKFKGLSAVGKMTKTATAMGELTTATTTVSTTVGQLRTASSGLSTKLVSLAKTLLAGIAIIAEVAAAALLIVGAIALLGVELNLVSKAWTPVIANAKTVAISVGTGTAVLVVVGAVTAALGVAGKTVCVKMGVGIAVLAEISAAADLFIGEIALMGTLLDRVGKKWTPVIRTAPTVKTAIATGTALLVAIGVVTAALGAATIGTAGTIPLAIGVGTALLVELAAAFVAFCESLVAVAKELSGNLSPALKKLNSKLPGLKTDMHDFAQFMTNFASEVVEYTKADVVAGLAATIDKIIGWFTEDPIDKLTDDIDKINDQLSGLNEKLNEAVPELETATNLLTSYRSFLAKMEKLTNTNVELSSGMFVNMNDVGQNLVTGFIAGIQSKSGEFSLVANLLVTGFTVTLISKANESKSSVSAWAKNLKAWFSSRSYGAICAETWQEYARNIVQGFRNGVGTNYSNSKSAITVWATNAKNWFSQKSQGGVCAWTWQEYAKNIVQGFRSGIMNSYSDSKPAVTAWATNVKKWFTQKAQGGVCAETWQEYAKNIVQGFRNGVSANYSNSRTAVIMWAVNAKNWFNQKSQGGVCAGTWLEYARNIVIGFKTGITNSYGNCRPAMTAWANNVKGWFNNPNGSSLYAGFRAIGMNVIQGFIDGSSNSYLWYLAKAKIRQFGAEIIRAGKEGLDEASPSKAFKRIGAYVIEGFNIGISSTMGTSFKVMGAWAKGVSAYAPALALAVDTSQLSAIENTPRLSRAVVADVRSNCTVTNDGFADNMETFYRDYIEPTFKAMAADVKRQADKNEQTVVKIGNRTVTDAVTAQKKANGYSFVN